MEIGKATAEILQRSKSLVKPGVSLEEVAKKVEEMVEERKIKFSFPINISINDQAAHYTPSFKDERIFKEGDMVKVDIGLRNEAIITDTALTVDLSSKNPKLVEATEKALESAISMVKAGRKLRDIGKEVGSIAEKYGVKPIKNLGGHGMEQGELHSHYFIPNFDNGDETELQEGDLIAVEVFLTDGYGEVDEGEYVQIFQKDAGATTRTNNIRDISDYIEEVYETYPFALRWLVEKFGSEFRVRSALNELMRNNTLELFPVLVERKKGMVAQAEHSLIVTKDSCEIITKI